MDRLRNIVVKGLREGFRSMAKLTKVVVPVVFVLTLIEYSPFFPALTAWLAPMARPVGLPGTAVLPLLTGLFINKMAGIASLLLLPLSPEQFFVAAVFLALAHNLVLEMLIPWQSKLPLLPVGLIRTGVAYVAALLTHRLLLATGWASSDLLSAAAGLGGAPGAMAGSVWLLAAQRSWSAVVKMAWFVIPLLLLMQAIKEFRWQERLESMVAPLARWVGIAPGLTSPLLVGLLLGVATGAAAFEQVMADLEDRGTVPDRRQIWRLNLFLLLFHSVIEDTLMFTLLPVPVLAVAGIRLGTAWLVARVVPQRGHERPLSRRDEALG